MIEDDLHTVVRGNSEFSRSLYNKLIATSDENVIFSPINIHSVLTLISQDPWFYNKRAFNSLLRVPDVNIATERYKDILTLINSVVDVSLANKALFKDSHELKETFKTRLLNNFLHDTGSINFSKSEDAADIINKWIVEKTHEQIKNQLDSSILDSQTCLMLLNAMHFSSKWAKPFEAKNTVPATFHVNEQETIEVQMMKTEGEFYYKNYFGTKVLELPFGNSDVSLLVILPWKDYAGKTYDLTKCTENMTRVEVKVSLPKFKIEETIELKQILSELGLADAFDADLFEVFNGEEVNLNKIQQKTFISVNEEGSDAATGTTSKIDILDDAKDPSKDGIIIYEMNMNTDISNRFAKTNVVWKLRNIKKDANMVDFKVVLTERAFITEFIMEIEEKSYKSYIKEKEEAKNIYNMAVAQGQSAGLVETTARDSKVFTVSVNVEPDIVTMFSLTYEEMLERVHDQYELVLNICPGQIVRNLNIQVQIAETKPLRFVNAPPLRRGNDISATANEKLLNPSPEIQKKNLNTAVVKFRPDPRKQRKFAHYLEEKISDGLSGQFVVQYDVEREPQDGEVLLQDGYFVHYLAPNDLDPLPKHVVFVLDTSGSMGSGKLDQLKVAMASILDEIRRDDMINIIEFNSQVIVWDIDARTNTALPIDKSMNFGDLSELPLPVPTCATEPMICNAKSVIQQMYSCGNTFMFGGLQTALCIVKMAQDRNAGKSENCQPIIVFLTDGQPNVGISSTEQIVQEITLSNKNIKVPIFSLSFGYGADKNFLRKLSLKNHGFSRHIYEASDASLQLQEFYKQISSPLLSDIKFKYDSEVQDVTRTYFPIYFGGSEMVVCGKYKDSSFPTFVHCCGPRGPIIIRSILDRPTTSLERLWAYLTVKQLLEERESADDKTELTRKAVDLALKYSFVTDVTSLVVVKPKETDALPSNYGSSGQSFGASRERTLLMRKRAVIPQARQQGGPTQLFGSFAGPPSQGFGASGGTSQLFDLSAATSPQAFGASAGSTPVFGSSGGPRAQAFGAFGGTTQLFGSSAAATPQPFGTSAGSTQFFGSSGGTSTGQGFGLLFGGLAKHASNTSQVTGFGSSAVQPTAVPFGGSGNGSFFGSPNFGQFGTSGGTQSGQTFSFGTPASGPVSGQVTDASGGTQSGQSSSFGTPAPGTQSFSFGLPAAGPTTGLVETSEGLLKQCLCRFLIYST